MTFLDLRRRGIDPEKTDPDEGLRRHGHLTITALQARLNEMQAAKKHRAEMRREAAASTATLTGYGNDTSPWEDAWDRLRDDERAWSSQP